MYPHVNNRTHTRRYTDRIFGWIEALKESDSFLFKLTACVVFASCIWLLTTFALGSRSEVPVRGGMFTEGVVGTPRFVNPVLAVTRADKDLTELIYDGLMSLGTEGILVPNIADSVTVSEDGLTYNVVLKKQVYFHDGAPLTARDVVYTVGRITDPLITSPLRPNFDGVTVEQVGEYELNFILKEPYTPFVENLTFGILPEHIWSSVTPEEFPFSQRNSEPVGAGPYMIDSIKRNESGIPEVYTLVSYGGYHRGAPRIEHFTFTFFPSEEKLVSAFQEGVVESMLVSDPGSLASGSLDLSKHDLIDAPLPRSFALFLNQNKSAVLRDKGVREALGVLIDREALVQSVLGGHGIPQYGTLLQGFGVDVPVYEAPGDREARARDILTTSGWKLSTETGVWEKEIEKTPTVLELSIATVNNPRFEATAEFIRQAWERLGIRVTVRQFEQSDLTQGIIRPRDYEVLLFGIQIGRSLDFYSFWHSSQRNDPGLNIALYANITTDALLTTARTTRDITKRNEALTTFSAEIDAESPALFLYQPELVYLIPKSVHNTHFEGMSEAYERFASVHDWYVDTESVWSFLAPKE